MISISDVLRELDDASNLAMNTPVTMRQDIFPCIQKEIQSSFPAYKRDKAHPCS